MAVLVLMNCQSFGAVTLRSDNPLDAPVIDSKLLSHPYDLQVATEVIRSAVQLICGSSIIPTEKLVTGPKSLKDADIEVSRALSTFSENINDNYSTGICPSQPWSFVARLRHRQDGEAWA